MLINKTPEKIETSRDDIVKRFDALVTLASVCSQTDYLLSVANSVLHVGHQDRPQHDCQPPIPDAGRDISLGKSACLLQHMPSANLTRLSPKIKAAEDLQTLIRHLQEMWLFGPLNTVGESQVQQQTDESAKIVGELLRQLSSKQQEGNSTNGEAMNEEP